MFRQCVQKLDLQDSLEPLQSYKSWAMRIIRTINDDSGVLLVLNLQHPYAQPRQADSNAAVSSYDPDSTRSILMCTSWRLLQKSHCTFL